MSKAKFPSNPDRIGVGIWYTLTLMAKHAVTDVKKNEFIDYVYLLSVEFPCGKCRIHFQEYLREHNFENYMNLKDDAGNDIGMFKWVWMFHNAVNMRLHKPFVDFQTAWEMFDTGREVCTNCSNSMSQNNSVNASYEDSFEEKSKKEKQERQERFEREERYEKQTLQIPKTKTYVDKKLIVQSYFLKKNK
jgi:hypothetical protein